MRLSDIGPHGLSVRWVLTRFSASAAVVWHYLSTYANNEGECWPKIPTIARDLGIADRTVQRALKELEDGGALLIKSDYADGSGAQVSNRYFLIYVDPEISRYQGPLPFQDPVTPASPSPDMDVTPPRRPSHRAGGTDVTASRFEGTRPSELDQETRAKLGRPVVVMPELRTWWEAFCAEYPRRSGDLKKAKAKLIFERFPKDVDRGAVVAGATAYRKWCEHTGKVKTELVQQMTTWLNGKAWENDWSIPEPEKLANRKKPVAGLDYWEASYTGEGGKIGWHRFKIVAGGKTSEPFDEEAWRKERGLE